MAEIVGAFGVPHTPTFPSKATGDTPLGSDLRRLYGEIASDLSEVGPDAIVVFSTDHFNTFFNYLPIFSIGVAESAIGPVDRPEDAPYKVAIDGSLGQEMRRHAVDAGFDVGVIQEFSLDHTFMVPYHFLVSELNIPIVPVFLNGLVAPTPSSGRCLALGSALRECLEHIPDSKRVAVIASGSISLDLGGIYDGDDIPDSDWVDRVVGLLSNAKVGQLVEDSTQTKLSRAGNIGGELLNWIAMLGMLESQGPTFLERQKGFGHAFGAWKIA